MKVMDLIERLQTYDLDSEATLALMSKGPKEIAICNLVRIETDGDTNGPILFGDNIDYPNDRIWKTKSLVE